MERKSGMGLMSASPIAPLYVCVHVPEFPAQARLRLRPELAHTPVAVVDGECFRLHEYVADETGGCRWVGDEFCGR